MKKFSCIVSILAPLLVVANEVTWSGGGGTEDRRWSSGANWVRGNAPAEGDIAVIPSGKTAWASHFDKDHGGDMTTINSLGGIRIEAGGRVEIDYEQDSTQPSCTFSMTAPLSGSGTFVVMNGVNNDRYLRMEVDNSSFNGSFVISNCLMRVRNVKGLGTGCPITLFGDANNKGLVYETSGVYTNDIVVYGGASSFPKIASAALSIGVTNLGSVTVSAGCVALEKLAVSGGLYNSNNGQQSIRISDARICGSGSFGGIMFTGGTNYVDAFMHVIDGASTYLIFCSDSRDGRVVMGGSYLSTQCSITMTRNTTRGLTLDLNGYDQAIDKLQFGTSTSLDQNLGGVEITSEKPATLSFKSTASTSGPCFGGIITGRASLEMASGMWQGLWFPIVSEGNTTKGSLIVRGGKLWLKPRCTFPQLSAIDIYGDSNNSPVRALVETSNVNPGKFQLRLGGQYATFEIADGVQLDAKTFLLDGEYMAEGVYGGAAAHEAYPELVDEAHVVDRMAGTGTLRVRLSGPPGAVLIFR